MASSGSSSPGERSKPEGTWSARDRNLPENQPAGSTISETKHDTDSNTSNDHNQDSNTGNVQQLPGLDNYDSESDSEHGSLPSLVEVATPEGAARGLHFEDLSRQAQMAYLVNSFNSMEFLQMTFKRANWEGEQRH